MQPRQIFCDGDLTIQSSLIGKNCVIIFKQGTLTIEGSIANESVFTLKLAEDACVSTSSRVLVKGNIGTSCKVISYIQFDVLGNIDNYTNVHVKYAGLSAKNIHRAVILNTQKNIIVEKIDSYSDITSTHGELTATEVASYVRVWTLGNINLSSAYLPGDADLQSFRGKVIRNAKPVPVGVSCENEYPIIPFDVAQLVYNIAAERHVSNITETRDRLLSQFKECFHPREIVSGKHCNMEYYMSALIAYNQFAKSFDYHQREMVTTHVIGSLQRLFTTTYANAHVVGLFAVANGNEVDEQCLTTHTGVEFFPLDTNPDMKLGEHFAVGNDIFRKSLAEEAHDGNFEKEIQYLRMIINDKKRAFAQMRENLLNTRHCRTLSKRF